MGDLQGKAVTPTTLASQNSSIEKTEQFANRAVKWWNTLILQYLSALPARDTPYQILVVSHGGWIGTLVRTLINSRKLMKADDITIGKCLNVSVTKIEMEDNRNGTVTKYGDVSHLVGKFVETNADELITHF
jgi:broad specificity phosphatase PhoE